MGGGVLWVILPFTKKNERQRIPEILDFSQLFIAYTPMRKKIQKFRLTPSQSTFGTPSKKIFEFWDLLGLPYKQNEEK